MLRSIRENLRYPGRCLTTMLSCISVGLAAHMDGGTERKALVALADPMANVPLKLVHKEWINHNTRKFRFKLPSDEHILGLPAGMHVMVLVKINGELVIRPYTPVSSDDDKGYVDFVIKIYFKNVHPKFPDGGKMTQHLEALEIGDSIEVRGPKGLLEYKGQGTFSVKTEPGTEAKLTVVKKVSLIAAGSGITPMLQLINQMLKDPQDQTHISLLYANQTENDILLRDELEQIQEAHPNRFKLWYTLDRAEEGWRYSTGFVNEDMIRDHLEPPAEDNFVIMSGPPPMLVYTCIPSLGKLGYSKDRYFAYGIILKEWGL